MIARTNTRQPKQGGAEDMARKRDGRAMINAATRDALDEIKRLRAREQRVSVKTRRQIGRIVHAMKESPGKYGARAIEQIAEALDCHPDTLYTAALVYEAWPEAAQIGTLMERRDPRGRPLTWCHLEVVAHQADAGTRETLLKRWEETGCSVRELKKEHGPTPSTDGTVAPDAGGDAKVHTVPDEQLTS